MSTELQEAKQALHQLMTGQQIAKMQKNGKSVEFTQANRKDLERYIAQLESKGSRGTIGIC